MPAALAVAAPLLGVGGSIVGGGVGTALSVGGALAGAGSTILGGMATRDQQYRQAGYASNYAAANAAEAQQAGEFNVESILQTALFNSSMQRAAGELEAAALEVMGANTQAVYEYNAGLRLMTGEYNAAVIESEAPLLVTNAELDELLLAQTVDQYVGEARAYYAASGVSMNEGTPVDVLIDMRTQENFEKTLIRANLDVALTKIANEAAMSRWQGQVEAAQLIAEGNLANMQARVDAGLTRYGGQMAAMGTMFQAGQDAATVNYNTALDVARITREGQYQSGQLQASGDQAFTTSLINAGTGMVTAYQNGAFDPLLQGKSKTSSGVRPVPYTPDVVGGGGAGNTQIAPVAMAPALT